MTEPSSAAFAPALPWLFALARTPASQPARLWPSPFPTLDQTPHLSRLRARACDIALSRSPTILQTSSSAWDLCSPAHHCPDMWRSFGRLRHAHLQTTCEAPDALDQELQHGRIHEAADAPALPAVHDLCPEVGPPLSPPVGRWAGGRPGVAGVGPGAHRARLRRRTPSDRAGVARRGPGRGLPALASPAMWSAVSQCGARASCACGGCAGGAADGLAAVALAPGC